MISVLTGLVVLALGLYEAKALSKLLGMGLVETTFIVIVFALTACWFTAKVVEQEQFRSRLR